MVERRCRWLNAGMSGLPVLVLAGSCTASEPKPVPQPSAAERRGATSAALLRELDLRVPNGIGDAPVPLAPTAKPLAPPPFVGTTGTLEDAARAADCLTAAVYYEARSESDDGQRAVAQVVLNRVRDRAFPNSVCGVVYQGSRRRTGCQFTFTCDGSMDRARNPAAWEHARTIATAALAGSVYAPIGAATFYHAYSVLPWWASSLARVGAIGAHIFYGWSGGLGRALSFRQAYAGVEPLTGASFATSMEVAGVQVHRGVDSVDGVTVHHGSAPSAAADVDLAVEPASSVRSAMVQGVRVHLGVASLPMPADAVQADPTATSARSGRQTT